MDNGMPIKNEECDNCFPKLNITWWARVHVITYHSWPRLATLNSYNYHADE